MEEKQVRALKKVPQEEVERPLLLSILIVIGTLFNSYLIIFSFYILIFNILLHWTNFSETNIIILLSELFLYIMISLIQIILLFFLWTGRKWARIIFIIMFFLSVLPAVSSIIQKFSITNIIYFILYALILLYLLLDKNVKAYCGK